MKKYKKKADRMNDEFSQHHEMLKKAVSLEVAAFTAVEIDTTHRIEEIIKSLEAEIKNRPYDILWFSNSSHALQVLDDAKVIVSQWKKDSIGVLFLADKGNKPELENYKNTAHQFWQQMNMLREAWAGLDCHIVFFLFPMNYRMMMQAADHLASWILLKLHLMPSPDKADNIENIFSPEKLSFKVAKQVMADLESQLMTSIDKGENESVFVRRYYIPLLEAALAVKDIEKAKQFREKILKNNVDASDLSKFRSLNIELDLHLQQFEQ